MLKNAMAKRLDQKIVMRKFKKLSSPRFIFKMLTILER